MSSIFGVSVFNRLSLYPSHVTRLASERAGDQPKSVSVATKISTPEHGAHSNAEHVTRDDNSADMV